MNRLVLETGKNLLEAEDFGVRGRKSGISAPWQFGGREGMMRR